MNLEVFLCPKRKCFLLRDAQDFFCLLPYNKREKEVSMHPSIYFFALGHLATDWSQGAIPALLPYFIARFGLSYQEAGLLVFANVLIASVM